MKTCVICDKNKPLDQFVFARNNRDNRSNRCKKCHSQATMHSLAQRRAKPTAKPATTDQERLAEHYATQSKVLDRYLYIPDLSHLEEIPTWKI